MNGMDLLFPDETPSSNAAGSSAPGFAAANKNAWKILVIDDEVEVHKVTELVLRNVKFDGSGLNFLHAYSAEQARGLLSDNEDIALALVDVVMETDHAGLDLVKWIRFPVLVNSSI